MYFYIITKLKRCITVWSWLFFPIHIKDVFFLEVPIFNFEVSISKSVNWYLVKNDFHLSFRIYMVMLPQRSWYHIRPQIFKIDDNIHSSTRRNSHKLPVLLLDILYQSEGWLDFWTDTKNDASVLRVLVNV